MNEIKNYIIGKCVFTTNELIGLYLLSKGINEPSYLTLGIAHYGLVRLCLDVPEMLFYRSIAVFNAQKLKKRLSNLEKKCDE